VLGSKDRNPLAATGFQTPAEASVHSLDEDVRLMLAFRAGDDAAFDALFERWAGRLLRYLERMLREPATAEELVQESFLRVYRARERYEPEARFSTWLYRIATNLALNELRRPRRRDPHDSLDAEDAAPLAQVQPATDDVVHARRMGEGVEAALGALPERQRLALWLSAVEGQSYADVARALDVSEKAVKALVHRARVSLTTRLDPDVVLGEG
jgi:RNA polymerase sigma-70 factor (ECF subfamily)